MNCDSDQNHTDTSDLEKFRKFYLNLNGINDDSEPNRASDLINDDFPRYNNTKIEDFQYYTIDEFNNKFTVEEYAEKDLKLMNYNVRGINCNYDNLVTYLSAISIRPDILVLTECHITKDLSNNDLTNKYKLEGYNLFFCKSIISYGGVIIYVKESIKATYNEELCESTEYYDSLYIDIGKINKKCNFTIGGLYRHCKQTNTDKICFINSINQHLTKLKLNKNKAIILGDMNINLMNCMADKESMIYINTLLGNGLEGHVFLPTRITFHKNSPILKSASLLDHIFSNLYEYECYSGNLKYEHSDHFGNFLIVKNVFLSKKTPKNPVLRRNYKQFDLINFENDFDKIDWNQNVLHEQNLDTCFENIITETEKLLDSHLPLSEMSHRKVKYIHKPWIDRYLLNEIRIQNNLYSKKCNPTNDINENSTNENRFKAQKNKVTTMRRKKKTAYLRNYFEKHRNDSRKMWSGINLALNQLKRKPSMPETIYDSENKLICNPQEMADKFATHFANVPNKTRKKLKHSDKHYLDYLNKVPVCQNYLILHNASIDDIYNLLNSLKNNSSPGPLSIPNYFLKQIAHKLAPPLTNAINKSLEYGYVPHILKIGKQTPVFKSGKHNLANFRPITVCNAFSKILEKVVRVRLDAFLKDNNIINKYQFGFRKAHSTSHALINLYEATLDGLETKLKTGGIYLDISKAFDTVSHDILLRKLEHYGIRENALLWFQSYLKDRTQYVEVNKCKSEPYTSNIGVPQGGVLSAILFILFTNDIIQSTKILKFSIYADDTCLIVSIKENKYHDNAIKELEKVIDWFSSNQLLLNIDKTDYTCFGPNYNKIYEKGDYDLFELHTVAPKFLYEFEDKHYTGPSAEEINKKGEFILYELHEITPNIYLNEYLINSDGDMISNNENVKYLGLYIDSRLKFNYHISITSCRISRMIGTFWKSPELDVKTKKILYHSLVESYLNYGILIWASEFSKNLMTDTNYDRIPCNLKKIISVQNKIIRAICRKPKFDKNTQTYTKSTPLYNQLKVLRLKELYLYNLGILVYEYYYNNDSPKLITEKFKKQNTPQNTRSNNLNLNYDVPKYIKSYGKPSIAGSILWNSLPNDIKMIDKKNTFKQKLKSYLLDKQV